MLIKLGIKGKENKNIFFSKQNVFTEQEFFYRTRMFLENKNV